MEGTREGELKDRVALVTGGNSGIGKVTARELAAKGMRVFLTSRTVAKGRPTVEEIREQTGNPNVECLALELGDFDSVRQCAADFLALDLPLHVLVNNAGIGVQRGLTPSGFELAFGTNHLGPFLFTGLLLERIVQSAPARIVIVSSVGHFSADGIDFDAASRTTKSQSGSAEYYRSKLANVLFAIELSRRLKGSGVNTYSFHPGVIATEIWRRFPRLITAIAKRFMLSVEEGATPSIHFASSPEVADQSGLYYDRFEAKQASAAARDEALAKKLWEQSEEWVGFKFPTL